MMGVCSIYFETSFPLIKTEKWYRTKNIGNRCNWRFKRSELGVNRTNRKTGVPVCT